VNLLLWNLNSTCTSTCLLVVLAKKKQIGTLLENHLVGLRLHKGGAWIPIVWVRRMLVFFSYSSFNMECDTRICESGKCDSRKCVFREMCIRGNGLRENRTRENGPGNGPRGNGPRGNGHTGKRTQTTFIMKYLLAIH
jgi:hypothetical protein